MATRSKHRTQTCPECGDTIMASATGNSAESQAIMTEHLYAKHGDPRDPFVLSRDAR